MCRRVRQYAKVLPYSFLIIQLKGRVDTEVSYHRYKTIKTNILKNKNLTTYD